MLAEFFEIIFDFLSTGREVLLIIMVNTFFLWILIFERFLFFKLSYPNLAKELIQNWMKRSDRTSWNARVIRDYTISKNGAKLFKNISLIKTLVAICPLLGLLGTVTGMIAVFEVMALTGTGNARLMASGISMATIPTMAGMVAALSGIYFGSLFENRAKIESKKLAEELSFSGD